MRRLALALVPFLALSVGACNALKRDGLKVHRFNQDEPQRMAVIQLGDPQIYSRETLINDRRREADFLKRLLEESEDEVFEPELRRSLRTLSSTAVRLAAAFDPLAGTGAERQDELAALEHRTELVRARAELVAAERELEDLLAEENGPRRVTATSEGEGGGDEDGDGGEGDGAAAGGDGDGGGGGAAGGAGAGTNASALAAIEASVERLRGILDELPDAAEVRAAATGASPRDVFRDRQAYRSELRAALSEVELDDAHDRGQNSLYRLQFRATVFPGEHPDKLGIARLTLEPPVLGEEELVELYKTWLAHVTSRLNQTESGELVSDSSYLLLGMGSQSEALFRIVEIAIGEEETLRIALPPEIHQILKPYLDEHGSAMLSLRNDVRQQVEELRDRETGKGVVAQMEAAVRVGSTGSCSLREDRRLSKSGSRRDDLPVQIFFAADDLYWSQDFFSASLRGVAQTELLSSTQRASIERVMQISADLSFWVNEYVEELARSGSKLGRCFAETKQPEGVPPRFFEILTESEIGSPAGGNRLRVAGNAFVYATAPVELAQRVSTLASASRSFEMALALAASLATQGVGAEAGLGMLRASQRELEALERVPLVVGFADRRAPGEEQPYEPQFGWIFGPRAEIDGRKLGSLQLRQPLINHLVTADLSVPGWWPSVTVHQENAWIANWRTGGEVLRTTTGEGRHHETFTVHLPLNRADLDGLTELLASKTTGGALPFTKITAVSPAEVAVCQDEVTFVVHGANVWRGTEAFLNGLAAKEVRLLPDMAGLAVTFEGVRNLPRRGGDASKALLTVWTRDGAASKEVGISDGRAVGLRCDGSAEPLLRLAVATPRLVGPSGVVKIVAQSGRLPRRYDHLGVAMRPVRFAAVLDGPLPDMPLIDAEGKSLSGPVDLTGAFADLKDGDLLESVLVEHFSPHEPPVYHPCHGRTVFYQNDETSKVRLATPSIRSLQQPVELLLPLRSDVGYPDLRTASLEGRVPGKPELLVAARQLEWPSATAPAPKLRAWLEVRGKGELAPGDRIELELRGASGLPAILHGPLRITGP